MEEMHTTLNKLNLGIPFFEEKKKLLTYLGKTELDDEPLPFTTILESNGLNDALWCAQSAPEYSRDWRLFAVWCARQVQDLIEDTRSLEAINVAENYALGIATEEELMAAFFLARKAVKATWSKSSYSPLKSLKEQKFEAVRVAACVAAANPGDAAYWAVVSVTWIDPAMEDSIIEMFKLMCQGKAPWQVLTPATNN